MSSQNIISNYSSIDQHQVILNGNTLPLEDATGQSFSNFAKSVYKGQLSKYSKFYKMDNLSKLAFLASDLLLQDSVFTDKYPNDKIGVVLGNTSATLDTDTTYFDSVKDRNNYFPSPANFVYTLPNIMIGEICIKHKIQGENICLVTEYNDLEPVLNYANLLLDTNQCEACVAGFVDLVGEQYSATIVLIEKKSNLTENTYFSQNQLRELLAKRPAHKNVY